MSPRNLFIWTLYSTPQSEKVPLYIYGLLAPSGVLVFILVYYIHTCPHPLFHFFQCLKDPTCAIFVTSQRHFYYYYYYYRVSLKKRSLRDWHPKKWFQGQPVKICRCKFFFWWFPKQSVAHVH